jgi:4'-phosphopantetheinyl transferase
MEVYWCKRSYQDVPASKDWLHPSEKEVVAGFKFPKKRNDWLLGRWTAKTAVKSFLAKSHSWLTFTQIEVRAAEDGAPEVFFEKKPLPVFISLSHSNGIGFCTIIQPGIALGCDLEKIEPRSDAFINDYFTEKEIAQLGINFPGPELGANLIWSAKESALKAMRSGLRVDPRHVEVSFEHTSKFKNWQNLEVSTPKYSKHFFGYWRTSADAFVETVLISEAPFKLLPLE